MPLTVLGKGREHTQLLDNYNIYEIDDTSLKSVLGLGYALHGFASSSVGLGDIHYNDTRAHQLTGLHFSFVTVWTSSLWLASVGICITRLAGWVRDQGRDGM